MSSVLKRPLLTKIRRGISCYVDFKVKNCYKSTPTQFLTLSNIFPVGGLSTLIQFPSLFKPSSFEYRRLNHNELCNVYGIPIHLQSHVCPTSFRSLIPLQLLQALLLPNLNEMSRSNQRNPRTIPQPIPDDKRGIWFSDLNKWLPEQWSSEHNTYNNRIVAKSDDAKVPICLWNNRIIKLFKNTTDSTCDTIRQFLMVIYCRKLFKEFSGIYPSGLTGSNEQRGGFGFGFG